MLKLVIQKSPSLKLFGRKSSSKFHKPLRINLAISHRTIRMPHHLIKLFIQDFQWNFMYPAILQETILTISNSESSPI